MNRNTRVRMRYETDFDGRVPYPIFERAARHWDQLVGVKGAHPSYENGLEKFMRYNVRNDSMWFEDRDTGIVRVPLDTVEKFNMLASPYFRTLLKAYEAKHGPVVYSSEQGNAGS